MIPLKKRRTNRPLGGRRKFVLLLLVLALLVPAATAAPVSAQDGGNLIKGTAIAVSHGGTVVAVGFEEGVTRLYDYSTEEFVEYNISYTPTGTRPVTGLAWSFDDQMLAVATKDVVTVHGKYQAVDDRWQMQFEVPSEVTHLAWSNANLLLITYGDGSLMAVDVLNNNSFVLPEYLSVLDMEMYTTIKGDDQTYVLLSEDGALSVYVWGSFTLPTPIEFEGTDVQLAIGNGTVGVINGTEFAIFDLETGAEVYRVASDADSIVGNDQYFVLGKSGSKAVFNIYFSDSGEYRAFDNSLKASTVEFALDDTNALLQTSSGGLTLYELDTYDNLVGFGVPFVWEIRYHPRS